MNSYNYLGVDKTKDKTYYGEMIKIVNRSKSGSNDSSLY